MEVKCVANTEDPVSQQSGHVTFACCWPSSAKPTRLSWGSTSEDRRPGGHLTLMCLFFFFFEDVLMWGRGEAGVLSLWVTLSPRFLSFFLRLSLSLFGLVSSLPAWREALRLSASPARLIHPFFFDHLSLLPLSRPTGVGLVQAVGPICYVLV